MDRLNLALYFIFTLLLSCRPSVDEPVDMQGATQGLRAPQNIVVLTTNPSSNPTPRFLVEGNFQIGNTIALYLNSSCSGDNMGSVVAQNNASAYVTSLPLTEDGTYTYYSKTISRSGESSDCSESQATYSFQTGQTNLILDLASREGANLTPYVIVSNVTIGASVFIFTDSSCTQLAGSESFVKSTMVEVKVNDNVLTNDGPYTFFARQVLGNSNGPCTGGIPPATYILNTKPRFMQTLSISPGMELRPTIRVGNSSDPNGALVPGAQVNLFSEPTCDPINNVGSITAASNETTVVITINRDLTADGTHKFYSTQKFNNHTSPCSLVFSQYDLDTNPTISVVSNSPGKDANPIFNVSGLLPGSKALLYEGPGGGSTCMGTLVGEMESTGSSVNVQTNKPLILSGAYQYSARQILPDSSTLDLAEYISPCSDVNPPDDTYIFNSPKVFFLTSSPNKINTPSIAVNDLSLTTTDVELYNGSVCGGPIQKTVPTGGNTYISFEVPMIPVDGSSFYSVREINGSGSGECLGSANYILNTRPEDFEMVDPSLPIGNDATPTFKIANIVDYATTTVNLYNTSNCLGTSVGSFTGPAITGEIQITVSTPIDAEGSRSYFASQSIDGGIPSCSVQSIIYEYDLKPPVVKLAGPSYSNDPTPAIIVDEILDEGKINIYTGANGCETLRGTSPKGNGTTRTIISSALGVNDQGTNIYWATQEVDGVTSACSTANATYNFSSSVGNVLIVTDSGALPVATGPSNTPLIQVRNVASNAFVEIFADNSCSIFMGSGISTSSVINITSSPLGLEGEHKYYAKQTIDGVPGPCSSDFATYILDTKPDAPILLTNSPNTILTPTVRVTNVIPGAQIKLFLDNNCADLVGEAQAITSQVDVTVSASNPLVVDGMYYFYVRQVNAGHISPCSDSSSPVYVLDTRPQGMEILTAPFQATPENSWNDPTPLVRVSGVEPGANVILFKDMNCQEDIGSGISQQNFIDIEVNNGALPNDGPYTFYSRQSYRGHTSWCSGTSNPMTSVSYKLDTTISLSVPGPNPNNLLSPEIFAHQTFSSAVVELFSDSNCTVSISDPVTSAGRDTSIFINPPFAGDGEKAIFGKQVIDGYNSPCSNQLTYTLFSAPTIELDSAISPSPGNDNTPTFILSDLMVEPSAGTTTVTIFDDINCSSPVSATEVITGSTMQVTINPLTIVGEQTYFASQSSPLAGHTSTCSPTGAVYDFDLSPTVEMVTSSPNDILRPEVKVSNIVIGADVGLFTDNNCLDLVGSATGATATEVFITLDNDLPVDARYFFYARQTALGNTSPCSDTPAEYTLKTDDFLMAPQFPKSTDTTPDVIVSNIGAGDRMTLYFDDMCLIPASLEATSTGTQVSVTSFPLDTTQVDHVWYGVRKIGNQGFQSRCVGPSEPYELDIRPSTVVAASVPNPGVDLEPIFQVSGVNSFATVTIYTDSDCTAGNETGSANTGPANSIMVPTDPPLTSDGPFSVWARQLINGQLSDCSTDFGTYILDSSPLGPITTLTSSPGDNPNAKIRVDGVVAGAQVDLHLDDTCSSAITGIGTVPTGNTSVEIDSFPLGQDGTYEFWAKQTLPSDPPYVSTCSATSTTYVLDTVPTNMHTLTTQPSAQNAPKILVEGVGNGDFVQLFRDAACTLPSGSNISSGPSVAIKVLPALADPNTYTFYSKRTQSGGLGITSKCSGEFGISTDFIFNPALSYKWEFSAEVKKDVQSVSDEAGYAVTGSENYLAMGVPGDGGGRVFFWKYNGFFWESDDNIVSSDITNGDRFGASLDLYTFNPNGQITNGDLLIVGAPEKGSNRGSAYIYTYNNGTWGSEQKINPSGIGNGDLFGSSVAIYNNLALIGAA
jgi:hypothetical protein